MLERNPFEYTNGLICIGNRGVRGGLSGVVAFDHWTGKSCVIHVVGSGNWITKRFLWAAFDYPFNQAKCEYVFGRVSTGNRAVLNLGLRIGFQWISTIPNVYPDGNEAVLCMSKSECKWLEINHGFKSISTAPA
jgi:hypothetical protein